MGGRTFNIVVILFWCSTMSWLVITKVLPPLRRGEPPTLDRTFPQADELVCWRLTLNDRPIGWAASKSVRDAGGVLEVHSRVVIERMPLEAMIPPLLSALLRQKLGDVDLDARSLLTIDQFHKLSDLRTLISVAEMENAVMLSGRVEDGKLQLNLRVAGAPYPIDPLPANSLLSGEFLPQSEFPDLHLGQTWTIPVFSPFRPNSPLEILQASVEREEVVHWNGAAHLAWVIVYRRDSGSGISTAGKPRGKTWVSKVGVVLWQEISLLNSELRFVRIADDEAAGYRDELDSKGLEKLRIPSRPGWQESEFEAEELLPDED